jgi:hypothetical protein
MALRLDHANLAVRGVDETIRFLQVAFPEFRIRAEGTGWLGARWVHVGTDDVYLALHQATGNRPRNRHAGGPGRTAWLGSTDDAPRGACSKPATRTRACAHRTGSVYFHDQEATTGSSCSTAIRHQAQR